MCWKAADRDGNGDGNGDVKGDCDGDREGDSDDGGEMMAAMVLAENGKWRKATSEWWNERLSTGVSA